MNCYLSKNYKNTTNAGNKAKTDIEFIMAEMGFKNIGLPQTVCNNKIISFILTLIGVLKVPFSIRKGDVLVLQYPLKKYFSFVCRMAHMRGAKVVALIHDLGSFRRKALTIPQEIERLDNADYVIAHNEKMLAWLRDNGLQAKLGVLEIFDYLTGTESPRPLEASKPYSILYAGALNARKNTFLYEIGEHLQSVVFNLYGGGFDIERVKGREHFNYEGFLRPDELITKAKGDFGLVWDGFTISACTGDFGEYLQYNNPHKTSLYIRCELPVIIWKKAALADFIEQNGIGFAIDSLEQLEERLSALSAEEYIEMKKRVKTISRRVAIGYYARKAIAQAIEALR